MNSSSSSTVLSAGVNVADHTPVPELTVNVPDADHPLVPSSFVARTWASYSTFASRPVISAFKAVPAWPASVQAVAPDFRYRTS